MQGLFDVATRVFGARLVERAGVDTWHPDVHYFDVVDADGSVRAGVFLDHYARGAGYKPFVTHDLAAGKFEPAQGFTFPYKFRHGSVMPLTARELARLHGKATEERVVPTGTRRSALR